MRLPRITVPLVVALALVGGYSLRIAFTQPTLTAVFYSRPGDQATFVVDGLRCWGTARFFASLYQATPGVFAIRAYASEHKVVFIFDPGVISRDQIRAVMEAPIAFNHGTTVQACKCVSVK